MLQTRSVARRLKEKFPGLDLELITVTTKGDRIQNKPIAQLGGRGVFVKELEEALLANEVDLVVHSMKDLPTEMPDQLAVACVTEREDTRDCLISKDGLKFADLPAGARIATSSRRRTAQLRALRSDIIYIDIRGNVPTRIRKHEEGLCEAIILAAAGLKRLGLTGKISQYLDTSVSLPAVGQGALAVEARSGDNDVLSVLEAIDDHTSHREIAAERAFLDKLGGGCSVPIGGLAVMQPDSTILLTGCVASLDGSRVLRKSLRMSSDDPAALGTTLAAEMIEDGAGEILTELKKGPPPAVSPP